MKQAPNNSDGADFTMAHIYNGRPAYGADAQAVDAYATWLCAARKFCIPAIIGKPLNSSETFGIPLTVYLGPYSDHLALQMIASGKGWVEATCTGDAVNKIAVGAVTGGDSLETAEPVSSGPPMAPADVAVPSLDRALNPTFGASAQIITVVLSAYDLIAPTDPLAIHALCLVPTWYEGDL